MVIRKNLNEQIYEEIKQDIIEQRIKFGDKLINKELRDKYNVSSTPVRDAINRLHNDGLLDNITNSGARVINFDNKFATEINEIISMLSAEAIKLSAKKSNVSEVSVILRNCIKLQRYNIDNISYFEHDKNFHMTFFEFCKNESFKQIYSQYQTLWEILVKFYYKDGEFTRARAIDQHQHILEAYEQVDIPLAQRYLEQHYLDAVRPLSKLPNGTDPAL